MAVGERIRFFRAMRGMTQKYLGMLMGFPERSADVRMAQYESEDRTPKADLTAQLAEALDVSPKAIAVPDMDSMDGLMHTLFTLEDIYGLTIEGEEGDIRLRVNPFKGKDAAELNRMLHSWLQQANLLRSGEITQEEYDRWRYYYPQDDKSMIRAKILPKDLSDQLIKAEKKK